MMTNWPAASAVASATVLPPARSSTFAFGAARPAMTASPDGSTFAMSNAGPGADALAARGVAGTGGAAGTTAGFDSTGALATARSAGFGSSRSARIHTSAPAPAITTARAAAPTQTSVRCDGMLAHSRPQHIAQRDQLRQIPVAKPSFVFAEFVRDLRQRGPRFLMRELAVSGAGAADLLRRFRQRVEREVGALAAQPQIAKRASGDSARQFEAIDQIGRGEHAIACLTAKLLDARRGIDGVAEKNDLPLHRAHLAGHHGTAMKPGPHRDGCAELSAVVGRPSCEFVDGGETGRDTPAVSDSLLELPGRDQLIADIPMDFAPCRDDRLGEVEHETIEQAMKGERAKPLGQSRGALHVEEQEHPLF